VSSGRAADGVVILANAQSAGRGRYRRQWVSHHGNLYASFILSSESRDSRLSYSVAVAVAETLIQFGAAPGIKWPNDILIDGKKISGILIEYSKKFVIIGIGINIKSNPRVANYETTKLDNYAKATRDEVLNSLMKSIDLWTHRDFSKTKERWMQLAVGLEKNIVYRGARAVLCGINDDGALVLRKNAEYIFAYGDEISIDLSGEL
jgi:BirA family biotin operon repressor/biotin-[acetyl-CoA-carboxylase] ligase